MLLKKLVSVNGLPSYEDMVRETIKQEIGSFVDSMYTDRLGNLIAVKNSGAQGKHIALCAHMDEVGMVVAKITDSGAIKFKSWGVNEKVLVTKVVKIGEKGITGVIGAKPCHITNPEERTKIYELKDLYIDIGADSKGEAEKLIEIGDYVAFDSEYREFGDNKIKAKALDDRVGCSAIIELLKSNVSQKITAVFTVQEEIGMRGSITAANQVFADLVLNLEGTVCADHETDENFHVTSLGCGPAISLRDRNSVYLKPYRDFAVNTAKKHGIPCQFRRTDAGGTDAANFHVAHSGTPVIGLAVPSRYIHSPVSVIDKRDYENLVSLIGHIIADYADYETIDPPIKPEV